MPRSSRSRTTAVLFDWDETLLRSWEARSAALSQVFAMAGAETPTPVEFMREAQGMQYEIALAKLGHRLGADLDLFQHYRRNHWAAGAPVSLFEGVRDLLEALTSRELTLGIVTQKPRDVFIEDMRAGAALEMERLGVAHLFGAVVGSEDVTRYKPDPEGVLLAPSLLEASPQETLFVGDSPSDIRAALAAGCRAVHATWGIPAGTPSLTGVEPHLVADAPGAVLEVLR